MRAKNMTGYVQVYTGDGKGKTTAAFGLTLRATGAGLKVFIAQFIKTGDYSEIAALKRFSDLATVEQFGTGKFILDAPSLDDRQAAQRGLDRVQSVFQSGEYDLVVLDEANVAVACGVFSVKDLLKVIQLKPENVELVITGRNADPRIIEKADLVTEMIAVKHYFSNGVSARAGIEK
jgi:cob(I)alamin adenosyltransferase